MKKLTDPTLAASTETTVAVAPKKRGRTHLSEADKAHMQACRASASEVKTRLAALLLTPAVTAPEAWDNLPSCQFDRIANVVNGVIALKQNAKMADAVKQYKAACEASGEPVDEAYLANVATVAEPKRPKYSEAEKVALDKARKVAGSEAELGLLDEHMTDFRIWMDLPSDQLDAIAAITTAKASEMKAKRVAEAKAVIAALKADAGL